ncbi:hypothetical protein HN51_066061 [Arachis hypogaea]
MSPLIPIFGSVVGAFVGRLLYFGSEQSSSLMTIPLYGIVLFFCCALRGFFGVSLTRRYGRGLVLVIDTCLYFLVALYLGSFRIYTGLLLLSIICPVVSNEGGVILSMVSGDGSASSVNQPTPTYSTQPGSSSETGDNVIPPSPGEGPSHQGSVVRNERNRQCDFALYGSSWTIAPICWIRQGETIGLKDVVSTSPSGIGQWLWTDHRFLPSTSFGVKLANNLLDIGQSRIQAIANKTDSLSSAAELRYTINSTQRQKLAYNERWIISTVKPVSQLLNQKHKVVYLLSACARTITFLFSQHHQAPLPSAGIRTVDSFLVHHARRSCRRLKKKE